MAEWKDILSNDEERVKDDELINYVEDNLSAADRYEVEKKIMDSAFLNDAVEGLENIKKKENLDEYVKQLNKNLQQQLDFKKQRRLKRRLKDNPWIIVTILILLAICIIGYFVIRYNIK